MMNVKRVRLGAQLRLAAHDSEHGYATAELAITLPLLFVVAGVAVWVASLGVTKINLQSQATSIARIISRGDHYDLNNALQGFTAPNLYVSEDGEFVTVTLSVNSRAPVLATNVRVSAQATAKKEVSGLNDVP